jgi:predicted amidohydrolase
VGTDLIGEITHGPWTGYTYGGQSVACDPQGKILARGRDRESDVIVLDVTPGWRNPKPVSP